MESMAVIVDDEVDATTLQTFRRAYDQQVMRGAPSAKVCFDYAHALSRSSRADVERGIRLLEELLRRDAEDVSKRDYVFYLAVAHTRVKEYDRALAYIEVLLSAEPGNRQALDLKTLIEKRMKTEGLIGAAILGGGIAVVGGLIIAAVAAARR